MTNVAVGNASVWSPSERIRLSRRSSSDAMVVVSTVIDPSVSWRASPDATRVIDPLTSLVRPTASDSAGRLASCSVTR